MVLGIFQDAVVEGPVREQLSREKEERCRGGWAYQGTQSGP